MSCELAAKEKVVGLKQTRRAIASGKVTKVFLAKDADPKLTEPLRAMCDLAQIAVVDTCAMSELGKGCGIAVGTAACAVLGK